MIEEIKHEGSTFTAPTRQKRTAMVIAAGLLLTFLVADPKIAEDCSGRIISPGNFCVPTFYAWMLYLFPAGYFLYSFRSAIHSEVSFLNPTAKFNLTLYDELTELSDSIMQLREPERFEEEIALNERTLHLIRNIDRSPNLHGALLEIKSTLYTHMNIPKLRKSTAPLSELEMRQITGELQSVGYGIRKFSLERPRTEFLSAMLTEKNTNLFDYKLPYWFSQAVLACAAMRVLYELTRITWPVVSGILS